VRIWAWIAMMLVLALAGCSRPVQSPEQVAERAALALDVLQSAAYSVQIEHGAAFLDPARTLNLRQAEGELVRPDRSRSTAKVAAGGFVVSVKFVSIGATGYMTDPFSGRWTPAPADLVYNATYLFDREQGVAQIVRNLEGLAHAGEAKIDGVETTQLSGEVTADRLKVLTGGALAGDRVRVDVWIARDGDALHQLRLMEVSSAKRPVTWTLKISRHNQPITIDAPL
jgi:hypothetical protein